MTVHYAGVCDMWRDDGNEITAIVVILYTAKYV